MGSEIVMVDEFPFPTEITTTEALPLLGSGKNLFIHCFVHHQHHHIGGVHELLDFYVVSIGRFGSVF